MNNNNVSYDRGSEWRKWDLHVHTKGTSKNDQFESESFYEFCIKMFQEAIKQEISVIGITDYFNIDQYKQVKQFVNDIDRNNCFNVDDKEKIKKIFILPNVELRMLPVTGSERLINIHCLFNPDYSDKLENKFFGNIEFSNKDNNYKMNRQGMIELGASLDKSLDTEEKKYIKGIENFSITPDDLQQLYNKNLEFRENVVIIVSNSSQDGASGLQKHYDMLKNDNSSLEATRKGIYHLADCIFSSNPKDREYFLGKTSDGPDEVRNKCGSLKPCISGSDAHTEESLFKQNDKKYCWIKADPTFEGLKQILYEPEERVRIQETQPETKSGYQVIESITINEEKICNQNIKLNPNLNTIIGGRSTGKSTLIKVIANKIDNQMFKKLVGENESENEYIDDLVKYTTITWQDKEEDKDRDIEFFPQNYMYKIASKEEEKNELIEKIVKTTEHAEKLTAYDDFCRNNKRDIEGLLFDLFNRQGEINELQKNLKETGDKKGVEKEIQKIKENIEKITSNNDFSEDEKKELETLKETIENNENIIKSLKKDISELPFLKDKSLFNDSIVYDFNLLSDNVKPTIEAIFKNIQDTAQKDWQAQIEAQIEDIKKRCEKLITENENNEKKEVYKKGMQFLQANQQHQELDGRLRTENEKLSFIKDIEKKIQTLEGQKKELYDKVIECHLEYSTKINSLTKECPLEHEDIKIKIEQKFKRTECEAVMKNFIDQKANERKDYISDFINKYSNPEDVESITKDFLTRAINDKFTIKGYQDSRAFSVALLAENWFEISYQLNYQNDYFENMSPGKKAFVILKLLLDFSEKKCPILIDQPEDSLDNRAIYNELVTYIKNKKKDRQIILVTHNANVVVNADAEEVIVANQHGKGNSNKNGIKFYYISGSLENTKNKDKSIKTVLEAQGIREHICEILEGGVEAFEKRKKKYNF